MHPQGLVLRGEDLACVCERSKPTASQEMMRTYADADSFVHYLGVLFAISQGTTEGGRGLGLLTGPAWSAWSAWSPESKVAARSGAASPKRG